MRFMVGTTADGVPNVYRIESEGAFNLSATLPGLGSDQAQMAADPALVAPAARLPGSDPVALASLTPELPIDRPPTIICLGLTYTDDNKEGTYDITDYPAIFMRGRQSIMAAGQPLVRPICSEKLDYEAELMVIIDKGGRRISEDNALEHVFGYTVFNDGSVRDDQRKTHQWTPDKNFDRRGAIGPFVVTPEDLPAGAAGLKIESRVGTEILQSSNTGNMIWPAKTAIATISEDTTLLPGDHIALGIPPPASVTQKTSPALP